MNISLKTWALFFTAVFVLYTVFSFGMGLWTYTWHTTRCLTDKQVKRAVGYQADDEEGRIHKVESHRTVFSYAYSVNNSVYTSSRVAFSDKSSAMYKHNGWYEVYYNPYFHSVSVLEKGFHFNQFIFRIYVFCMLIPAVIFLGKWGRGFYLRRGG